MDLLADNISMVSGTPKKVYDPTLSLTFHAHSIAGNNLYNYQ